GDRRAVGDDDGDRLVPPDLGPHDLEGGQGGVRRHGERDVVVVHLGLGVHGRGGFDLLDLAAADDGEVPVEVYFHPDLEQVEEVHPAGDEAFGQGLAAVVLQDEVDARQLETADERDELGHVDVGLGPDVEFVAVGEVDDGLKGEQAVIPAGADLQLVIVRAPVEGRRAGGGAQVVAEAHHGAQHPRAL